MRLAGRWSGEGFAFTAAGHRLTLGVGPENNVIITNQQDIADGKEIVLGWLRNCATGVLEARKIQAKNRRAALSRHQERGQIPTSVEALIAYVGFS